MSAFVCPKRHFDVVVKAAFVHKATWRYEGQLRRLLVVGDPDSGNVGADQLGAMLQDECVRSVSFRYPNDDVETSLPGTYTDDTFSLGDWVAEYRYQDPGFEPTVGEARNALLCLAYQSCEHPGWETSDASAFTDQFLNHLGDAVPAEGPWSWSQQDVEARAGVAA